MQFFPGRNIFCPSLSFFAALFCAQDQPSHLISAAILALTFLVLVSASGCLLSVLLYRKGPAACKRFRMRRNGRPSHSVLMRLRDIESANREIRRLTKDLRRATDEAASAFGVFAEDAAAAAATRGHAVEAGETGREAQAGESTGLLNE